MPEIQLNNIVKTYQQGKIRALNDVSFSVEKGELFGLIGPDGAGKTSIFRILTTLLLPDIGTASLCGYDVVKSYRSIRRQVGYMPGKFSLYHDLSVEENLIFFATLFNTTVKENYDLIKDIYVQLEPFKDRRAGKLSGGMKQKLALCCALIHRPKVLLLDEPTTGVDTVSRKEFWEMLKRLREEGITMVVSTPYMDEASLCERIALIQNGNIMSVNTPADTVKEYEEELYALRADNMSRLLNEMRVHRNIKTCFAFGEYLHITFHEPGEAHQHQLLFDLEHREYKNVEIRKITPTIEDCFIRLMTS